MSCPKLDARKRYSPSRALRRSGGNNRLCQMASQSHWCAGYHRARAQQPLCSECSSTSL